MGDETLETLMRANLLEVFGERDPERRRSAIAGVYAEDVVFADTEGEVRGHAAIHAKVQEILDGAPGFVFRPDGPFAQAQDLGYLAWAFGPEGAEPVVRGADMGLIRDGRLAKVYTVLFR